MIETALGFPANTFADLGVDFIFKRERRAAVALWLRLLGPACPECGRIMRQAERGVSVVLTHQTLGIATLDHFLCQALGGHPTRASNLWVICLSCNQRKSEAEGAIADKMRNRGVDPRRFRKMVRDFLRQRQAGRRRAPAICPGGAVR